MYTVKGWVLRPRRTWRKNTGPGELSLTPDRHHEEQRGGDEQHGRADAQVEGALHEFVPRTEVRLGDLEEGQPGEVGQAGPPADQLVGARHHRDVDEVLQLAVDVQGFDGESSARRHQNTVHVELAARAAAGRPAHRESGFRSCGRRRRRCCPTSVMPGSWRTLSMIRSAAVPAPTTMHPGRRERVEEVTQDHTADGDRPDADDDRGDELGGVGLGRAEEGVEERTDGEGQHAAATHPERELAHLEEGARLQPTMGDAVDATEGECDDDRHREQGVDLGVRRELSRGVHRHRGELRQEEQREGEGDAGADEVAADLDERELLVGDGAVRRATGGPPGLAGATERGSDQEVRVAGHGVDRRRLARLDLRIRDAHRPPFGGAAAFGGGGLFRPLPWETAETASTVGGTGLRPVAWAGRTRSGGAADGVDATVDVEDLARGHREEVAEQGEAGLGHRRRIVDVPAERRPVGPGVLEGAEPRYRLGRHGAHGAGRDQVDPDAPGPELLGEIAREGLQPRLGHAHPVVDGPGHRGVEVEPHDRGATVRARRLEEGEKGIDEGLERVGRDVERRRHVFPVGGEHAAAQAVGRGEADGVQQAVEAIPTRRQRCSRRAQLLGRRDVDLEHLGLRRELAGGAPGEREGPACAGEDDLRTLLLGQAGHGEGQRGVGEDARDEEPFAVEKSHCASEVMRR